MAKAILRVEVDQATGKRTLSIAYESDEDALPQEHEQAHRALAEKVTGGLSGLKVERQGENPQPSNVAAGEAEREAVEQKG